MKKLGDPQISHATQPSFGGMVRRMARDIQGTGDPRFMRLWNYKPIPKLEKWWASGAQTNVIIGSNQSSKTHTGVTKAVMIYTGIVPPSLRNLYPHDIPMHRARRVRIVVQEYTKHWPRVIKPYLEDEALDGFLPKAWSNFDPDEHCYYGPDGSILDIYAADPNKNIDPTSMRGGKFDHTLIDEINRRPVYDEALARMIALQDGPGTVDLTYCPQNGMDCWTRNDLYSKGYNIDTNEELPEEEKNPAYNIVRVCVDDNPFVRDKAKQALRLSLKPWEMAYRYYGLYSNRSDDPFFNLQQLYDWECAGKVYDGVSAMVEKLEVDTEEGIFRCMLTEYSGSEDDLEWIIWDLPKNGRLYMVILDSAEGRASSDYQNADVFDCTSQRFPVQVAQLHVRVARPEKVAIDALCMAKIYGGHQGCLFVFEKNNTCGGVVLEKARAYENVYHRAESSRDVIDDTELLGWHSDHVCKPAACHELYSMFEEWGNDFCGIKSSASFTDLGTFQDRIDRDKEGNSKRVLGANLGAFDDCVTTASIMAYIVRNQYDTLTPSGHSEKLSELKQEVDIRRMLSAYLRENRARRAKDTLSPLEKKARDSLNSGGPRTMKKQQSLRSMVKARGGLNARRER